MTNDFYSRCKTMLERLQEQALEVAGQKVAEMLKDKLDEKEANDTGRVRDSITWATSQATNRAMVGSAAQEGDVIKPPSVPGIVFIGTAVPYAPYVEYGTYAHGQNREMMEQFINNLLEWAARHGWQARDGGELKYSDIYPLIKKIRENGTDEMPFVRPVLAELNSGGLSVIRGAFQNLMRKEIDAMPKGTTTIDLNVDMNRS